jgi:hypothetical protein
MSQHSKQSIYYYHDFYSFITFNVRGRGDMGIINVIDATQHGFVAPEQIPQIVAEDRFFRLLVRCNNGRFLCPAQDAQHFIDLVNASGKDWVRDVSIPANHQ